MSDEENIVCYVCNDPEDDPNRVLECVQCCRSAHFSCLKISGNAILKARKKNYYCSPSCAEIYSRNPSKTTGYDAVMGEIHTMTSLIRQVKVDIEKNSSTLMQTREEMKGLIATTQKIEQSQIFLSEKFEELKESLEEFNAELEKLRQENRETRSEVKDICGRQQYLEEKVGRLEAELDKMQRDSLSKNAVIMGVPYMENENVNDLVVKVGVAVKLTISPDEITAARRLKTKSGPTVAGPLIVSFRTPQTKESLFDCKRAHGTLIASGIDNAFGSSTSKIIIRDEMTAFGKELLEEAKQAQSKLDIKYVWMGRNGKVLLRRYDGAKVEEICNKQQLYSLARVTQKRGLDSSSSSMLLESSPVHEQQPKRR